MFVVYSGDLDKVYLVPVENVGITRTHLRLEPSKNNQEQNVRWARNYELVVGPAGVEPATNQVE